MRNISKIIISSLLYAIFVIIAYNALAYYLIGPQLWKYLTRNLPPITNRRMPENIVYEYFKAHQQYALILMIVDIVIIIASVTPFAYYMYKNLKYHKNTTVVS